MKLRRAALEDAEGICPGACAVLEGSYPGIIPEAILKNLSLPERETAWRNNSRMKLQGALIL